MAAGGTFGRSAGVGEAGGERGDGGGERRRSAPTGATAAGTRRTVPHTRGASCQAAGGVAALGRTRRTRDAPGVIARSEGGLRGGDAQGEVPLASAGPRELATIKRIPSTK